MKTRWMLLLVLVACSCRKQMSVDIPDQRHKPVINLLIAKDSLVITQLSYTGTPNLGPNTQPWTREIVKNATVKLYENDVFQEDLQLVDMGYNAVYKSTMRARPGANYRVTAEIPGYPEMEGHDSVPRRAAVGEVSMREVPSDDRRGRANVSVELFDRPGERNYYRIRLYEQISFLVGNTLRNYLQPIPMMSTDPLDILFNKKERNEFFTNDALYNGRSPRFNFIAVSESKFKYPLIVEVATLTNDSYNYLFSSFMASEKNEDVLSEKVIVFNNVRNGFGIVGGMSIDHYYAKK